MGPTSGAFVWRWPFVWRWTLLTAMMLVITGLLIWATNRFIAQQVAEIPPPPPPRFVIVTSEWLGDHRFQLVRETQTGRCFLVVGRSSFVALTEVAAETCRPTEGR